MAPEELVGALQVIEHGQDVIQSRLVGNQWSAVLAVLQIGEAQLGPIVAKGAHLL